MECSCAVAAIEQALAQNATPHDSGWRRFFSTWNFGLLQWQDGGGRFAAGGADRLGNLVCGPPRPT